MQTFNQSLADLVLRGIITRELAISRSSFPDELATMLEEGKSLTAAHGRPGR
jgi:Tfp pilus assembly pilus retraction ATPase PilT